MKNFEKEKCCGCMACFNVCPVNAISIEEDIEGFKYPVIDEEKCINCGLCKKVCDFNKDHINNKHNKKVYAVKHKNLDIRNKSTSGGIFSALADSIIENNGYVYGAMLDENLNVKHVRNTTKEESIRCRGSKYVQSDIKDVYNLVINDLNDDNYVLFTGTACQVEGLKSYLKIKNVNSEKLITCDFICHGVPSKRVFKDHIQNLENKYNKKVVKYRFRTKEKGWKGHNEEATFDDGVVIDSGKYLNIYKELYGSLCIIRPSCYSCPYASMNHMSDITIGDFWGGETAYTEFFDNQGVSFVMLNTEKGENLFNSISKQIDSIEADAEICVNPQLRNPVRYPETREKFWKEYNEKGFLKVAKKYTTFGKIKLVKKKIYNLLKFIKIDKFLLNRRKQL